MSNYKKFIPLNTDDENQNISFNYNSETKEIKMTNGEQNLSLGTIGQQTPNLKDQIIQLIENDEEFRNQILNKINKTNYSSLPLTFKSKGRSKLKITIANDEMVYDTFVGGYYYKLNDNTILNCNKNQTFNLKNSDVISFYGAWNAFANSNGYYPPQIVFQINEGDIDVFGNINSLQNFSKLFVNGAQNYVSLAKFKGVRDASKIILPPIVVQNCYIEMFKDCTSLIKAPILPGTIAPDCYSHMFEGCTNLNLIEVNFTSWKIGMKTFTDSWVYKVAQEGTFIKPTQLPEEYGSNRIPKNWTVINK